MNTKDKKKLQAGLEELMTHYTKLSNQEGLTDSQCLYFRGETEGLNKAWKLLNGESVKNLKG